MESVRTFIAVELPPAARAALAQAAEALQNADRGAARSVKWVDPAGMHLTLKFLGETPADRIDAIAHAIEQAVAGRRVGALHLGHAGCFPGLRQPRVLWVGIEGDVEGLAQLQAAIEATVSPLGFPTEDRRWSPHLTLGRVRDDALPDVRQRLGAAVQSLHAPALSFAVAGVSLMRSDLRPTGPVYSRLAHAPLP